MHEVQIVVFWVVAPRCLTDGYQRFGGTTRQITHSRNNLISYAVEMLLERADTNMIPYEHSVLLSEERWLKGSPEIETNV
jgi:hypothetical protein